MRRALLTAVFALVASASPAAASSLPSVSSGHRPGPAILYRAVATAPQLQNAGIWHAPPILISGASAYRDGEYLYQGFLYDDHGADGQDPGQLNDPFVSSQAFARPNGTYTYPTNPAYAGNAANLIEFRVRPLPHATAFRLTFNTMIDPKLVAATIVIGSSPRPRELPFGGNATAPAHLFLTWHGYQAVLQDAATGRLAPVGPRVSVDVHRHQVQLVVPHSDWNPGRQTVRLAAAAGLWDAAHGRYLIPQASATSTEPGGAGVLTHPTAFFDVAFRHHEPMPHPEQLVAEVMQPSWWRDADQGQALAQNDLSPFHVEVNFGKLLDHVSDEMSGRPQGVPRSGPMDRILPSHFSGGQGIDFSHTCGSTSCHGELRGNLQPYAIYIPPGPRPRGGYGLVLLLHSLSSNYNQFLSSHNQRQFGAVNRGSIVITPEGRGPDGWYYDWAGADTFEVWADVARHYQLDPARTVIAGYSMGGYATWKFASQYPDLFAAGQPTVGPTVLGTEYTGLSAPAAGESTNTIHQLASLRNVPFLIWVASSDEIVPTVGTLPNAQEMDALGYRYEYDAFAPAEHLTLAVNDQFAPAAAFLNHRTVNLSPPHVTYAYNPTMDFSADGTTAGHAYWLSGIRLRSLSGDPPIGTVDARSLGFGQSDPVPSATTPTAGTLPPGNLGVLSYAGQQKTWGPVPSRPARNQLDITATNVSAVTVDPARARIGCHAVLDIQSDGPIAVTLSGCQRVVHSGGGE